MASKKKPPSKATKSKSPQKSGRSRKPLTDQIEPDRPRSKTQARAASLQYTRLIGDLGRIWAELGNKVKLEFRVSCVRPDDLLVCDFIFENLKLVTSAETPPKLVRRDENAAATLIVEFPPQSFAEQALLDDTGPEVTTTPLDTDRYAETVPESLRVPPGTTPTPGKLKPKNVPTSDDPFPGLAQLAVRMSGPSRLAFTMPAGETELTLTIEAILEACRRWPMKLGVHAVPDPPPPEILVIPGLSILDTWAANITNSAAWRSAQDSLFAEVGGAAKKKMAGAARRIATKTVEAIRSGATRRLDQTLFRAMNDELDVLAEKFTALDSANSRKVAALSLSLLATQEVVKHRFAGSLGELGILPFIPLLGPHEPAPNVTALELPYRLILSPVPESFWHHSIKPATRRGRTELWHTRLSSEEKDIGPDRRTSVRALWSPDYAATDNIDKVNKNKPFRMPLDPLDRQMLVKLTTGFNELTQQGQLFHPRTARTQRLALSSLGGLLDLEGNWDPPAPDGVSLEQWRHLASLGRDHYVRVVYRGFLKDLRHAASLIKVTERKFEGPIDRRVAVLRQRFFIIVREPVKRYSGEGHTHNGIDFPFTEAEILTRVTPSLRAPDLPECRLSDNTIYADPGGVPHRACFWPMIDANTNFKFQVAFTDLAGRRITFPMPLLFVGIEANNNPAIISKIIAANNKEDAETRRRGHPGNASICYAHIDEGKKGDPRLPTSWITFKAGKVSGLSTDEAQFYPEMEAAGVDIAAIQRLLQKTNPEPIVVEYPEVYKTSAFGPGNPGELFLKLKKPNPLEFGDKVKSDALGGIATPSMQILGLSRTMGPVAAEPPANLDNIEASLGDIIGNRFNPADFFAGARILGGVGLNEILKPLTDLSKEEVPKLLSQDFVDRVEARFDWRTREVQPDGKKKFLPNQNGPTTFEMHGLVSAPLNKGNPTTFEAIATLDNFKVNLFGAVTVWFDKLRFTAKTGAKPDVTVDLHPGEDAIRFGGALEFVNELRKIIPSNGFSDPPGISVTPSGISASYSLSIPSLAVGIFALEHVSLGAGFLLPFDAKPAEVRFNFAERQRPFSLTVSLLGGGGFFAICVGTEGIREIEASLEFGAALAINLGVASGSVEVKAGVYYHWKTQSVELSGYVRLHGELSVLGLISASLTFLLQLGYTKENKKSVVWGEAKLEVEIEILFISFSVSVSCRREFGGSPGDPKFIELIPDQGTWTTYCEAFATEA